MEINTAMCYSQTYGSDDLDGNDQSDDDISIKPAKKTKSTSTKLDDFFGQKEESATKAKKTMAQKMHPRTPPKARKGIQAKPSKVVDISDDSDAAGPSTEDVVPRQRTARGAARAPAKYIELSSDGGKDDDDESFQME